MSFLTTIFHGIGKAADFLVSKSASGLGTGLKVAGPFIAMLNPAAGAIVNKVSAIILGVEALVQTEKEGILKRQTASQIAMAEIPQLQEVIAQFGPNIKIPEAELGAVIDAGVAHYNAIDKLILAIEAENGKAAAAVAK